MDIGWPEILIIAVVILVLFGSRKMPDAARAVGRSLRILKTEVKGLHDDDEPASSSPAAPPAQLPAGQTTVPPAQPPSTTGAGERTDQH
jgi:sec-independent protein translocase protein TatA